MQPMSWQVMKESQNLMKPSCMSMKCLLFQGQSSQFTLLQLSLQLFHLVVNLCKLELKKRSKTNEITNKMLARVKTERRVQLSCFLRSLMLWLAWFPDVAYFSFKSNFVTISRNIIVKYKSVELSFQGKHSSSWSLRSRLISDNETCNIFNSKITKAVYKTHKSVSRCFT